MEGQELQDYMDKQAQLKIMQEEEALKRALADQDEEDEMDQDELILNETDKTVYHPFDIYVKDVSRSSGFFKHAQTFKMFPVYESRTRVDDYGEIIDPGSYMREEEQNAIEAAATGVSLDKPNVILPKISNSFHIPLG